MNAYLCAWREVNNVKEMEARIYDIAEHPEMDEDDLAEHIAYWLDLD